MSHTSFLSLSDSSWQLHRRHPRTLVPHRQLEAGEDGEWRVTGSEAAFLWQGPRPLPGWNMIELAGERSVTGVAASLSFETRHGATTVDMPLRAGKVTKRLVRVPVGTQRIVFCPMNARGSIRLTHLRCVWLTPWFARDRLLQRLVTSHQRYRGRSKPEVRREIASRAREAKRGWIAQAMDDYETTFISLCSKHNYRQWIEQIESGRRRGSRARVEAGPRATLLLPLDAETGDVAAAIGDLEARLACLGRQAHDDREALVLLPARASGALRDAALQAVASLSEGRLLEAPEDDGAARLNAALEGARGELILLLAPGARLADEALAHLADAFEQQPAPWLLYADEDRLDADGQRHAPNFKPDWNPDLLLSQPYLGQMLGFSRRALEAMGGYVSGGESAPWQATLQATALRLLATHGEEAGRRVRHLPFVLMHRGDAPGLPAHDAVAGEDGGAVARTQRCLDEIARRTGRPAARAVAGLLPDSVRVCWPVPEPAPLVTLLVPTRDGVAILRPCVDAILKRTDYRHFELLILDNQSTCPETLAYMDEVERRDARVRVLRWNHPFNYSAINNFGARQARGEIIGLVNNDIEPIGPAWLTEMVAQASRPEIGCVGAKLYYPNDTVQHGGVILGLGSIAGHGHRFFLRDEEGFQGRLKVTQNLSAVTAACLLLRRSVFEAVGGLNEADLAVAYNDVDLCLKVREAGYRNLWTPHAELYHHESVSRGADDTPKKRARWLAECDYMRRTWGPQLDHDPAYNPNLTLVHEDFSLR